MTNNQIDFYQDPNELSDDELAAVSGGGAIGELLDATKDFVTGVYEVGKELISDIDDRASASQNLLTNPGLSDLS